MSLFPKVSWPFNYLTLTQNKLSKFFECYLLFDHFFLTMIDELYMYICPVFLCKSNPIKAHLETGSWPFCFERSATFPPQEDHVCVDLFSSMVDGGGNLWVETPQTKYVLTAFIIMGICIVYY